MAAVSSILLALHLICMNVASAGPICCIWFDRKVCRKQDTSFSPVVRFLAWASCTLSLLGVLFGLALGFVLWSDDYAQVLEKFSRRISWGILEFAISVLLILVYAVWVGVRPSAGRFAWIARSILAFAAATNLLYHFPPLFTMIAGTATGFYEVGQAVDSATFRRLLAEGEVLALTTHFIVASFAVVGTLLQLAGVGLLGSKAENRHAAAWGARLALAMTLLQIPIGIWLVTQLPGTQQREVLGSDLLTAGLFVGAILATFWLLHQLAAAAFGEVTPKSAAMSALAMGMVIVLMTAVLQVSQDRNEARERPPREEAAANG